MRLYVWYPALRGSTSRHVTWGEIVDETKPLHAAPNDAKAYARQVFQLLNADEFRGTDSSSRAARVDSISRVSMASRWRATAAPGRYPVVLLTPGSPGGFMVAAELLASHGFVVISLAQRNHGTIESMDFTPNAANIDAEVRDMEFALGAARGWRNTDAGRVGVVGFSTGSLSALAFAFHSRVPSAVISIEGWEGTDAGVPIMRAYRHYDALGFKAPYLLIGKQAEDAAPFQKTLSFLDSLRAAPRWRVLFDSATHGDFLGLSRSNRKIFRQTNETVLSFFKAQLASSSQPNEDTNQNVHWEPPGKVNIRAQAFSRTTALAGREEFFRLAETNAVKALEMLRTARERDANAPAPFAESSLNRLANLTRDRRPEEALIINEIVALGFPESARAHARLSDAYWNARQLENARTAARRALLLLDRDAAVPADQRATLRTRLEGRLGN